MTRKAVIDRSHQILIILVEEKKVQKGKMISKWNEVFHINERDKSKGREAVTVYIIKYIPACRRSGWYPHPKISKRVGIKEASKKI